MLPLGAALLAEPERASSWWPWPLTPLTGRAVGAWLVALAVMEVQLLLQNDFGRARSVFVSAVAMALLHLVAVGRYPDTVDWSPEGWLYVLFVVGLLAVGLYGLRSAATRA